MDRKTAYEELTVRLEDHNRIKHSLAVEAIMIRLAELLQEDANLWGNAGLLHDIDLEKVNGDLSRHGQLAAEILEGLNVNPTVIYAIQSHNPNLGFERRRKIDKALFCANSMSHFVLFCVQLLPQKKLAALEPEFVLKNLGDERFAKADLRERIQSCAEIGLSVDDFIYISLDALKKIHYQLGV